MSSTETIATSHINKTPRRKQQFQVHSDSSCLSPAPGGGKLRSSLQSISSQRSIRSSMGIMSGYGVGGCSNSINSAVYKSMATPGTRVSCGRSTVGSLRLTSPHSASIFSLQSLATTQSGALGRHGNKRRAESSLNRAVLLPDELDGLATCLGVNIDAKGTNMDGKVIGGDNEKDTDALFLSDNDDDESTINSDGAMSLNDDVVFKDLAKDDKEDTILFDCKGSLLTEQEIYHPSNPPYHPHSHSHDNENRDNTCSLPSGMNPPEDAAPKTFTDRKVGLQQPVSSSSPVLQQIKLPTVNVSHAGQEQERKQDTSIQSRKKLQDQNCGPTSNSSPKMKSLLNSPYASSRTNRNYGNSKKSVGLTKKGSFVF